jgi:DNA-binding XRE family transcriptional regulator
MATATRSKLKTRTPAADTAPDYPYTLRLKDGRQVLVEVPAKWVRRVGGEVCFTGEGAMFLDRVRAVLMRVDAGSNWAHVRTLREALGLTQRQLGEALGVDKLTVSRWERGEIKPGSASIKRLRKLQGQATRRGLVLG